MAWSVFADNHESAVIAFFEHNGVPVIIHHGGRYPTLVNEAGLRTRDLPVVTVVNWGDRVLITAWSGEWHHGDKPKICIATLPLIEDRDALIAAARPYLDEAVARTATIHAEWVAAFKRILALPQGQLSREVYESACATHGAPVHADEDILANEAVRHGDYAYPKHPVDRHVELSLAQQRMYAILWERQAESRAATQAQRMAGAAARNARMAQLRLLPASGVETRRVPASHLPVVGREFLDPRGRLLRITRCVSCGIILDDDPSIHGEHLLGHEGERAIDVTYEVREEAA